LLYEQGISAGVRISVRSGFSGVAHSFGIYQDVITHPACHWFCVRNSREAPDRSPNRSRETGLSERLEESGRIGALLKIELRVREWGGTGESVLVTLGLLTLYFLVFAVYFLAFDLMSEVF
tara:strand:- start:1272 stop:1634 length:363 start_codon:yes stop_codon:yes gene_type:complete